MELNERLVSLTKKNENLVKKVENFDKLMSYGRQLEQEDKNQNIDVPKLLENVCLDEEYPSITIKRLELSKLKNVQKASIAIRNSIDLLFEE